jgi:hypothetical protein
VKTIIIIVLLLIGVCVGLAYLPPEKTEELAGGAAGVASKGYQGAKSFLSSFKQGWEEAREKEGGAAGAQE